MTRYMVENVPGIIIPEAIVKRMNDAPKGKGAETGLAICAEIIEQLREIEGVGGHPHHGHRVGAEGARNRGDGKAAAPSRARMIGRIVVPCR